MKLLELFTDPYKLNWTEHNEDEIHVTFTTDQDTEVTVAFDRMGLNLWNVSFDAAYWDHKNKVQIKTFLKTGQGDAPRIFATVIAATQEFVNKYKPKYLWFTASLTEPSRVKLYNTMAKKFAQNQFELIEHPDQDPELPEYVKRRLGNTQQGSKHFVLRNKQFNIKQNLNELFDNPYQSKWVKKTKDKTDAVFTTQDGTEITVLFNNIDNMTTIGFEAKYFDQPSGQTIITFLATGKGDAPRIFATILAAIKKFITEKKPDYLFFTSLEPSRTKLYNTMVRILATDYSRLHVTAIDKMQTTKRVKRILANYAEELPPDEMFILEKKTKQKLNELFAKPYEFEGSSGTYTFETASGNQYTVLFEYESVYDKDAKQWFSGPSVVFGLTNRKHDFGMKVEKTGDAFNVFATVSEIIKQYLSQNRRENYLIFAAAKSEPSRLKLYNAFMKMLPQVLPEFVPYKIIDDFDNELRFYILTKKGRGY